MNGPVHPAVFVGEDTHRNELRSECRHLPFAVGRHDANEHKESSTERCNHEIVHCHGGICDPLDNRPHCLSLVVTQCQPTLGGMVRSVTLSIARGFAMGAADIVPGVSGGTIALIFGIYERLIASIRAGSSALGHLMRADLAGTKRWLDEVEWAFILALGGGILLAIASLARLLETLLREQAVLMAAMFLGLVAGSIVITWSLLRHKTLNRALILVGVGLAVFVLLGLRGGTTEDSVSQITDPTLWAFFGAGAIAICAMILPGISGSFLLVIMGMYGPVLGAVTDRDVVSLGVFTVGAVIGLALFSQLLHKALTMYHDAVLAALIGIMAGSLRVLWPWPLGVDSTVIGAPDSQIIGSIVVAAVAFVLVILIARVALRLEEYDVVATDTS